MIKLKLIVAGAKDVGKTSLIRRYIHGTFLTETISTIGVDFMVKKIQMDDKEVHLSLWDFAGEKKFRSLFPGYISGASGALILFDLTNRDSFNDLGDWMKLINNASGKISKLLIVSKIDLIEQRQVSEEEITNFIQNNNIDGVLRCSAKTGENVEEVFSTMIHQILESILKQCPHCGEYIAKDLYFCTFCGRSQP